MNREARILFHDYGGHAFTAQIARKLAMSGRQVTYSSFADFATPKGRVAQQGSDAKSFRAVEFRLQRPFNKENLLVRAQQQLEYGRLVAAYVTSHEPAVVFSSNSPLEVQRLIMRACRSIGSKFVFWMQDIHSDAIGRILSRKSITIGRLAAIYYRSFERRLLLSSDSVILIADDFAELVGPGGWGVPKDRLTVIENWAPLDDIPPLPRDNEWALANLRPSRSRIICSGTLARKHDASILVELAGKVAADVYLFSEGRGAQTVKHLAEGAGLTNLFVRPWVSVEDFPKMLASADLLCAFIERDAGMFSVPSRILSYLAAGRAIVASIPEDNLASRTIRRAKAGLVSNPEERRTLAQNAVKLLDDDLERRRLGVNGRAFAEKQFDIEEIASKFEAVLRAL